MARRRGNADWELDLKPVERAPSLKPAPQRLNGAAPAPVAAPQTLSPQIAQTLQEIRAASAAVQHQLGELTNSVNVIQQSIEQLTVRVAHVETELANEAARAAEVVAAPRPARPLRQTSRTIRESGTGPLERRPARPRAVGDDSSSE